MSRILAALFVATLTLVFAAHAGRAQTPPAFTESFTGNPATPAPWPGTGWDVQRHSRDVTTWAQPDMMEAQHGPGCEAPGTNGTVTHHVMSWADTVFQCRDHVMTALRADGYGAIYLTPPAMADWSAGEAVVRWSMSTLRTSNRDWVDLWLTPYAENMALPLDDWLPDLRGKPRNGLHVRQDFSTNAFQVFQTRNGVESDLTGWDRAPYDAVLVPDAGRRDVFELRVSATRLRLTMPQYAYTMVDVPLSGLTYSQAVVQFGHHSYTPDKAPDCGPPPGQSACRAGTWHWDDVSIAPAVPLAITRLVPRLVQSEIDLSFPAAGTGARLRFAAVGGVSVSFDGGASWSAATAQPSTGPNDPFHAGSYFLSVPAGATRVRFRITGGWWRAGAVFDPHIWAAGSASVPTPTPTPTATPTATPTPAPTATPVPLRQCRVQERVGSSWVTRRTYQAEAC